MNIKPPVTITGHSQCGQDSYFMEHISSCNMKKKKKKYTNPTHFIILSSGSFLFSCKVNLAIADVKKKKKGVWPSSQQLAKKSPLANQKTVESCASFSHVTNVWFIHFC